MGYPGRASVTLPAYARGVQGRRTGLSLAIGAIAGLVVAGLIGVPRLVGPATLDSFVSNAFTFWGVLVGSFVAVATAGVIFAFLSRGDRKRSRWGRVVAGLALGGFAAGTILFIATWAPSPFSLEGLWMYPLALTTTVGAVMLLRRRRPGAWDEPPT